MPKSDQPQRHLPALAAHHIPLPRSRQRHTSHVPRRRRNLLARSHPMLCSATRLSASASQKACEICAQEWMRLRSGRHITSHEHCKLRIMAPGGGSQPARERAMAGFVKAKPSKKGSNGTASHNQDKNRTWKRREGKKVSTPTQSIIASKGEGPTPPYLRITFLIFLKGC